MDCPKTASTSASTGGASSHANSRTGPREAVLSTRNRRQVLHAPTARTTRVPTSRTVVVDVRKLGAIAAEVSASSTWLRMRRLGVGTQKSCEAPLPAASTASGTQQIADSASAASTDRVRSRRQASTTNCAGTTSTASKPQYIAAVSDAKYASHGRQSPPSASTSHSSARNEAATSAIIGA